MVLAEALYPVYSAIEASAADLSIWSSSLVIPAMISRTTLGRNAQRAVLRRQCQCQAQPNNRRGLAAAASGSFTYETGEAAGVKYGSRDLPGPTTHVAVVAKAGTRYQPAPGFTDGLEKFAFKVRVEKGRKILNDDGIERICIELVG